MLPLRLLDEFISKGELSLLLRWLLIEELQSIYLFSHVGWQGHTLFDFEFTSEMGEQLLLEDEQ